MKKIILLFIIINIFTINLVIASNVISDDDFVYIAEDYIFKKKFYKLKNISNSKLRKNSDYYIAAYYKAYSMMKIGRKSALSYYLEYIKSCPWMPDNYKEKWVEIALDINEKKKVKIKKSLALYSTNRKIDIKNSDNEIYTKSKILSDNDNYYYLAKNGELYLIKKVSKKAKKINYYKTKDFRILDGYLIFNDSVNLINYDLKKEKYDVIHTFEKDDISFISTCSALLQSVLKHQEFENYLIKKINYKTKELKELPDNCIAQSKGYIYFVMSYEDKFEIFNYINDNILTFNGKFICFGINESEIYYYNDNYLYFEDINYNIKKKIIYLPEYKNLIDFKIISYNKILLCFDEYLFEYTISNNKVFLTRGKLIHIFRTGFMYINNEEKICFKNLLKNSVKILFDDIKILDDIVFSDKNSSIFMIKKGESLFINYFR